jgi:O-antigen/teichoic acid export membrane protein
VRLRAGWGGEALWVAVGQGMGALGSLVGVRLLTQNLDPGPYGELALAMAAVALSVQTFVQPFHESALRFLGSAREAGQTGAYLRSIASLTGRVLALLAVLAAVVAALWGIGGAGRLGLLLGVCAVVLFSVVNGALNGIQSAARHRMIVAWHDGIGQWLRFLLATLAVITFGATSDWAMAGYALASALVLTSQAWLFWRNPFFAEAWRSRPDAAQRHEWERRMKEYAWPFAAWGLFAGLQSISGRWALELFADTHDVGLYAVLIQLGYYPVILAYGMATALVAPVLFSGVGSGADAARTTRGRRLCWAMILGAVVMTFLGAGLAALLHGWVFALFAAPAYRGVSWLLPAMVLGSGLFACGHTASFLFLIESRPRELMPVKVWTAVLGIALSALGAARGGIPGVVYGGLAFSLVYFLSVLYGARRPVT